MAANHPQMSTALKNIADLNAVYLQHQRESLKAAEDETRREKAKSSKKSSKKSRKDSKRKDKKSRKDKKEKKGKKEKKEKKEKKSRKTREASSSSSDSSDASSSDSDLDSASEDNRVRRRGGGRAAQRDELERGRTAAECARQILAKFPDVRGDLRGLLRTVDDGEAVAVDGIPDERLKALIAHLFRSLGLHESSKTGAYLLPKDATSTSVRLAMIFDMTPAQLAPFERARSPWRTPEPRPEPAETTKTFAKTDRGDDGNLEGRAMTGEQADALLGSEEDISSGDEEAGKGRGQGARRKGPPPGAPDVAGVTDPLGAETERETGAVTDAVNIGPSLRPNPYDKPPGTDPSTGKRVLGPMVPPKAMLDAAALEAARWASESVGPAPPEIVEEVELTGMDAKIAAADKALAADADPAKDAYDVLGVPPTEATPSVLKKTYWRMSLMVHPDKCEHPNAADAFDVVKKAHQSLLDPTQRAAIDATREEKKKMEGFDEWLAGERERAEWRRLQGTPLPTDDEILNGPKPPEDEAGREEWMTKLPPQLRPRAGAPLGKSMTAFAAKTFVERDASTVADWTDTPKDAATREARLFLAAQEKRYALPAVQAAHANAKAEESKKLVDEFNEKRRPRSLLEQHREKAEKESKDARARARAEKKAKEKAKAEKSSKKRKKGDTGADEGEEGDGTGWEYKPWNRDTDLEAGRTSTKALNPEDMMKKAGGDLKGRFGSAGDSRSFL